MAKSKSYVYNMIYPEFCGADFSEDPSLISPRHFAYLENMYRDYGTTAVAGAETIPGFRRLRTFDGPIYGIYPSPQGDGLTVHAGQGLYQLTREEFDTEKEPQALTAKNRAALAACRSEAVLLDRRLLLLDGEHYLIADGKEYSPAEEIAYLPTLYADDVRTEQKNLLTREYYEERQLFDIASFGYGTAKLQYTVTLDGLCYVSGIYGSDSTVVIPSRVKLGKREYAVSGVETDAFRNNATIKTLIVSAGVCDLQMRAFFGMTALETVVLPEGIVRIPIQCFSDCPLLQTLYLPTSLASVESYAFSGTSLTAVHYRGSAEEYASIEGTEQIFPLSNPGNCTLYPMSGYEKVYACIPLHEKAEAVLSVTLDGETLFSTGSGVRWAIEADYTGKIFGLRLEADNESALYGRLLRIRLRGKDDFASQLAAGGWKYTGSSVDAIRRCRKICRFDGRIFLTGNPDLPGMVFYSQPTRAGVVDPTYFGCYNYFTDGNGVAEVRAMTPLGAFLFIFTAEYPGEASLFCHQGQDGPSDVMTRIYPVTEGIGDAGCSGGATTFGDEVVFLSQRGLTAVEYHGVAYERSLTHRSGAVDRPLCAEALSEATLFRFGTYLGIGVNGHIYLADGRCTETRDGHTEYTWYYLSDIGIYEGQTDRYRYLSSLPSGLIGKKIRIGEEEREPALSEREYYADGEEVYSVRTTDGEAEVFYVLRDGTPYLVDTDGEKYGGVFHPASVFCGIDGLLFFGTDSGSLALFNTDKRGVDGRIPREWYTFNGRAYFSGCATRSENCSLPHLAKNTVRGYSVIKLKNMPGERVYARVRTDRDDWEDCDVLYGGTTEYGEYDFSVTDFASGAVRTVHLDEKKKHWAEKQYYFFSEEYQRPFGLVSVAYRYSVAGRIRI